jgi:hypothetical protein
LRGRVRDPRLAAARRPAAPRLHPLRRPAPSASAPLPPVSVEQPLPPAACGEAPLPPSPTTSIAVAVTNPPNPNSRGGRCARLTRGRVFVYRADSTRIPYIFSSLIFLRIGAGKYGEGPNKSDEWFAQGKMVHQPPASALFCCFLWVEW